VPQAYLAKVVQALAHGGVVRSQRGIGGGVSLVKAPAELTLLGVVRAVDPIRRIETCPLGLAAHGVRLCPLHRRLDNALALVEDAFRRTTLAEVLAEPSESVPPCDPLLGKNVPLKGGAPSPRPRVNGSRAAETSRSKRAASGGGRKGWLAARWAVRIELFRPGAHPCRGAVRGGARR
jgi:Rrf2 family protein